MDKEKALVVTTKKEPTGSKSAMINAIRYALEEVVQSLAKINTGSATLTDKEKALISIANTLMDAFVTCAQLND